MTSVTRQTAVPAVVVQADGAQRAVDVAEVRVVEDRRAGRYGDRGHGGLGHGGASLVPWSGGGRGHAAAITPALSAVPPGSWPKTSRS
ncbi:hypothetical protein [Streptomyces fodineus]|uniref:hypothetical protein n=1 Tax=Streptomyces fodineus TaxID=1904616 RepID=UPI00131DC39A|nr:hypothetical protein [Streptomyces fodineus]